MYESEAKSLNSLIKQFNNLSNEKTALINNLSNGVENVEEADAQVEEFISRYNDFNNQDKGINKEELVSKIAEIEKVKETIEAELTTLEGGFNQVATATEQIKLETEEVEKQIDKDVRKMEELKQQEEALKEEYGQAITLQPVPIETWAESVEVDRTYWQAEFHPDNEVVEGFKRRWFEVSLKDADKKVKLLFGPGEYFLTANDFRNSYGSTIGTFVTEALHSLDQPDQEKVKLFIQGSADISGHNTFSGKLEDSFFYDEIEVFPIVTNQERFSPIPLEKLIPEDDFRNDHLPDLRAAFLKEMFMRYSNKFEPIILEGAVKKFEGKEERNATIYLFFPEALLPAFEKN